jgi:hypothetical protein
VSAVASRGGERVRSAELVAALCLATDLGMGFPFEHRLDEQRRGSRAVGYDEDPARSGLHLCLLRPMLRLGVAMIPP